MQVSISRVIYLDLSLMFLQKQLLVKDVNNGMVNASQILKTKFWCFKMFVLLCFQCL